MRILHLIDGGGMYGAEVALLNLAYEQTRLGFEVAILSARRPHDKSKAIDLAAESRGLRVVPWPMEPGLNLSEGKRIKKWATDNQFQVLHSHGYKFNIIFNALPRSNRFVFISTIHGYTAPSIFSRLFLYKLIDLMLLGRSSAIVVVSRLLIQRYRAFKNATFIPNGIQVDSRETNPTKDENKYVLFLGRLSDEKDPMKIVDIFSTAVARNSPYSLVIAGDGPLRNKMENKVQQLDLRGAVKFEGYVDNPDALIRNAAALVLTSLTEGFPMVILEAMRAGTVVFATPVGEIPAILGDRERGYLFPSNDEREMSAFLFERLADFEEAAEISRAARDFFNDNYTARMMAERYAAVYRSKLEAL